MTKDQYSNLLQANTAYRLMYPAHIVAEFLDGEAYISCWDKTYREVDKYLSTCTEQEQEALYNRYIKVFMPFKRL
jgi:hypothetical protein